MNINNYNNMELYKNSIDVSHPNTIFGCKLKALKVGYVLSKIIIKI